MAQTINGIIAWLKGWFFDKDEITSKEQALQTQINNKASQSDLNTTNGNVSNLQSGKIDTAGTGLSKSGTTLNHSNSIAAQNSAVLKKIKYDAQGHITGTANVTEYDLPSHYHSSDDITEANYQNYMNLSPAGDTQSDVNYAIDEAIGNLSQLNAIEIVATLPTASASTLGKLYIINENNKVNVYYTERIGGQYTWHKMDSDILDELSIAWNDVTGKPNTFTPSSHSHGNISNDGKLTTETNNVKKAVVTDNNDNIALVSVNKLNCGSFAELQSLINNVSSGGTLILEKDYMNSGSESNITISKPITIIGKNHVLDGNNVSRIFDIANAGNGSVITDLSFVNAYNQNNSNGGAVNCWSNNTFVRCNFVNNSLLNSLPNCFGGAIHSENNVEIYDCNFNNNSAKNVGGAVRCGTGSLIKDSSFIKNTANLGGGIYSINESIAINCEFISSTTYNVVSTDYLTNAVTSIELVDKTTDSTGAIILYYGDEPT